MSESQKAGCVSGFKQCNHYFLTMGADETITFCNNNFSGKFVTDDYNTTTFSNILSDHDVVPFREAFDTCISSPGKCVHGSSQLINQNNEPHFVKWEMVAEAKPDADTAIYLVAYDNNEAAIKDSEIKRSRKILKAIYDSTENVNFFISPDLKIQFFNKKAFLNGIKLHGKKVKVGDNILDYARDTQNNIDQLFVSDFNKALQGETAVRETKIKYYTNQDLWVRSEYYPVYDQGHLIGISITVCDISERKKREESIKLQNEKLHKIAFIQSHQVRQPLSNILGLLSLIDTSNLSDDDKYLMRILNLSAGQLDSIIRKIVLEAQLIDHEKEILDHTDNPKGM